MTLTERRRPLEGTKVVEFAGLAPGPFVGMVLADFGAEVIRIDRVGTTFNGDTLCRGKKSVALDPKTPEGLSALKGLVSKADVLIDPFRPGVMERLGLGPDDMLSSNPRLVYARLTGFQRVGDFANMAGHDINYIALSGVLSLLGRADEKPMFPANVLADFGGGGLMCTLGVVLALFERQRSGKGQVVETDMVSGVRYLSTFLLLGSYFDSLVEGPPFSDGSNERRGKNLLDGGAPFYDVYKTSDGGWMSIGALEPQFYRVLLATLKEATPTPPPLLKEHPSPSSQADRSTWPALASYLTAVFGMRTRAEWTRIFLGKDACVAPVLDRDESAVADERARSAAAVVGSASSSERSGGDGRVLERRDGEEEEKNGEPISPHVAPTLSRTPGGPLPSASASAGPAFTFLTPGEHTYEVLRREVGMGEEEVKRLVQSGAAGCAGEGGGGGGRASKL